MKFTVLLSLYSKERAEYLIACLDSIKNNTTPPDQVLIIYDGPIGKNLEEVVDMYRDCLSIDTVSLSQNIGLGKALNHGIDFCRNEIILRMDTDDVCVNDRFEKQINFLERNPAIALLGGAIDEYDEKMICPKGVRFSVSEHEQIRLYCKKRNPFNHMTIAFRKSVITKVGGYHHHYAIEDYNLWLRVISAGYETHNMEDILVHVRAGGNMLSRRRGIAYIKSEIQLAKLKYKLKIDNIVGIVSCTLLRSLPRLLPVSLLSIIYKRFRK